jgi:hypothetical protein
MKKVILSVAVVSALLAGTAAKAQLMDEQNVTVTMDLQPILQLNMNGASNVDFIFDQISEYVGGITQYGATQLSVSSTVAWDLYAAGFSSNASGGNLFWDNQVVYGADTDPNSVTSLPLTLLELHQDKANPAGGGAGISEDYSDAFSSGTLNIGNNNVYATSVPYTRPDAAAKYIAGGFAAVADFVEAGTYLVTNASGVGFGSDYSYTIDYRIVPGLPAIFPRASDGTAVNGGNNATADDLVNANGAGSYAQPGVYTMNVKYVLVEN